VAGNGVACFAVFAIGRDTTSWRRGAAQDGRDSRVRPRARGRVSLLWLLFGGTAAVMVGAAAVLAFTPVTIHASTTTHELIGLLAGLGVMLLLNLLFLRSALAPLRRLTTLMGSIDLLRPGRRIGEVGWAGREVGQLAHAFDEMLERLEREHRESARRALAAQEGERLRVARELHDELGQTLTAIALRAEAATDNDRETLGEIAEALQQSINEVRRIARELRPEALDDLGLVNALIAMCGRIGTAGGVWIEREFASDLPELGADADLVVYRVAQEALTNAVRHARASSIALTLSHAGELVTLTVCDDGRGLPEPLEEGSGISGMRERALLIHAQFEIRASDDGHGTVVRLRLHGSSPGPAR
jgi:two-component system sensor histidine kinase UhpB